MSKELDLLHPTPDNDVHLVWHRFQDKFKPKGEWKWSGYVLMDKIQRWAKRYPTEVQVTSCDDDIYAGSLLVLIEHRSTSDYFGTTILFISQFEAPPAILFLYPDHRKYLLSALKALGGKRGSL